LPVVPLILKPQIYFKYLEFRAFAVPCLQFEELLAEKIRAASQRVRSRDLYDLAKAAEKPFNQTQLRSLVVIKCWNVGDGFDPERFFERIQSAKYDWDDLKQLVRRSERINPKPLIAACRQRYEFLMDLTKDERRLIADAKGHKLKKVSKSLLAK
jgi:predicted nucleotidyltransferase component of viral defense system